MKIKKPFYIKSLSGYQRSSVFYSTFFKSISRDGTQLLLPFAANATDSFKSLALLKSFAEFYERSALVYNNFINRSINKVSASWNPFVANQLLKNEYEIFSEHQQTVNAFSWNRNRLEPIPAELVYFGEANDRRIYPNIDSTGVACHLSPTASAEIGALELIEKNCLIIMWLLKKSKGRICIPSILREKFLEKTNCLELEDFYIFDISFFSCCSTVLCLGRFRSGKVKQSVGAATEKNLEKAIEKAVAEMLQIRAIVEIGESFSLDLTKDSFFSLFLDSVFKGRLFSDYSFLFSDENFEFYSFSCRAATNFSVLDELSAYVDLYLYTYPTRISRYTVTKVISPDLAWSLIPHSGDFPSNRRYLFNFVGAMPNHFSPIVFP